jgi:hypothetical protein
MKRLLLAVFTLGMALTGYAQTTPTTQVKTIADLVALGIPTINNRLSALVTGRVTENDGGGGVFYYDGASVVATNLGTVFKPAASAGRWLRQYVGEIYPQWFGAINGNNSPYDTATVQACLDFAALSDLRPVKFASTYYVTTITIESSFQSIDFNSHKLIGVSTTPSTDAILLIQSYSAILRDVHVDCNFNTNYRAAVRWFGDATHTNPGGNDIFGMFIENAITGLVIGAHPGDAPYNAPLSESSVYDLKYRGTERCLYINQPNGKLNFYGPVLAVTKNEWDAANPGVFDFSTAYCLFNDPTGGAELNIFGGTLLNSETGSETGLGIGASNVAITDAIWEIKPVCLILGDRVVIRGNRNTGGGFSVGNNMFEAGTNVTGSVTFDSIEFSRPSGQSAANDASFFDSSNSTNLVVNLVNSHITEWDWNYASAINPIVKGCEFNLINTTWETLSPVLKYKVSTIPNGNVLTTADTSFTSISAAPVSSSSAGFWSLIVSTGSNTINKDTSDYPGTIGTSVVLTSVAGQAAYIYSPRGKQGFPVKAETSLVLSAWAKGTSIKIMKFEWWQYDGSASSTADTTVYTIPAGAGDHNDWHRVLIPANVPADASFASVFIYSEGDGYFKVAGLSVLSGLGGIPGTIAPLTATSIPYIGTGGVFTEENSAFSWANASQSMGIGVNPPTDGALHIKQSSAGSLRPRIAITDTAGSGSWLLQPWKVTGDGNFYIVRSTGTGDVYYDGNLISPTAGSGFKLKEGSNARMGTATLVGGTIAVANTSVTANTRIFISRSTTGGTEGHLSTTQIASTSFTVNSTSGTDTSTVNWLLIEPSP